MARDNFLIHPAPQLRRAGQPQPWEAFYYIPEQTGSLLDIGCNVGEGLQYAYELGVRKLVGIDINPHAVAIAQHRLRHLEDCTICWGSADALPLADETIEVTMACEVLEHIPTDARARVIQEIHRVLTDRGVFILSIPARGLFSWLDPANARLRFPSLFRRFATMVGGAGREHGSTRQKHGIEWHHHFSLKELTALLAPGFRIRMIRWRGCLLSPLCSWLGFPFYRRRAADHWAFQLLRFAQRLDHAVQFGELLAYNVLLVAEKVSRGGQGAHKEQHGAPA